jgi:hypothetical protein
MKCGNFYPTEQLLILNKKLALSMTYSYQGISTEGNRNQPE